MSMDYLLHLLVFVLLYAMVALSLNVTSGLTQLVSLAHAGFYGVGAYTAAILATRWGFPLWIDLPLGMVAGAIIAVPVAVVAMRTVQDYFIICTMGVGVILFSAMNNCMELTRGPLGIAGIPTVSVLGHPLTAKWEWAVLTGMFYAAMYYVAGNLERSPLGRVLVALSEDEIFCQALGKNVGRAKLQSFVLGAALATIPGTLYAHYVSFIDPTSFTINESIFVLSIVIIGGMGSLRGSLLATILMILMPELLRLIGLPSSIAANLRQALYGAAMIVVIRLRQERETVGLPAKDSQPASQQNLAGERERQGA